jgi:hypothetical protein
MMDMNELKRKALILEWNAGKYLPRSQCTHDVYLIQYVGDCKALDNEWKPVNVNTFMNVLLQEVMFNELRHIITVLYTQPLVGTNHMFKIDRVAGKEGKW